MTVIAERQQFTKNYNDSSECDLAQARPRDKVSPTRIEKSRKPASWFEAIVDEPIVNPSSLFRSLKIVLGRTIA
jgi:hypothetical protein